jgi:hypothetical protein
MQKARGHAGSVLAEPPRSHRSRARGFRFSVLPWTGFFPPFGRPTGFAIGRHRVLSLAGRSPRIQAGFHVPDPTRVPTRAIAVVAYGTLTRCGAVFQRTSARRRRSLNRRPHDPAGFRRRFRLVPVRSPLLGESRLLSLPPGTEMFQFPGLYAGIPGSLPAGRLPRTSRSLRRPLLRMTPRHPPRALMGLTTPTRPRDPAPPGGRRRIRPPYGRGRPRSPRPRPRLSGARAASERSLDQQGVTFVDELVPLPHFWLCDERPNCQETGRPRASPRRRAIFMARRAADSFRVAPVWPLARGRDSRVGRLPRPAPSGGRGDGHVRAALGAALRREAAGRVLVLRGRWPRGSSSPACSPASGRRRRSIVVA